MTRLSAPWTDPHVLGEVKVTTPDTHTGDTNWTPVTGGSTGSIMLEAATDYKLDLSAEIKTSSAAQEGRIRAYDVTGATALMSAHTDQTVDDNWRSVFCIVTPGAGAREYRLEMKIDNGAQTVTVGQAFLLVEHL